MAAAHTTTEWQGRSIYQVVVHEFSVWQRLRLPLTQQRFGEPNNLLLPLNKVLDITNLILGIVLVEWNVDDGSQTQDLEMFTKF